jgi:hypothetical protein
MGPVQLVDVTAENITAWLNSLACGKKSWNNYRGSIGALFNWAKREPRNWLEKSPVGGVTASVGRMFRIHLQDVGGFQHLEMVAVVLLARRHRVGHGSPPPVVRPVGNLAGPAQPDIVLKNGRNA